MGKIRVLVADDHPIWLEGLCRFLEAEEDMECAGKARDGEEAIRLIREVCPDVAILDVDMPKINGIDVARQIKEVSPTTAVLIVSAFQYDQYIAACIEAGVQGYLLKRTGRSNLMNAIRMIHDGESVFDYKATRGVLRRMAVGKAIAGRIELRERELQVLRQAAKGMTNKEIAKELIISENTVGSHFVNIFRKLGVQSRTEAVLYALKEGLISMGSLVSEGKPDLAKGNKDT